LQVIESKELFWLELPFSSLLGRVAQLPHAILLQGPQGVGLRVLAERFATALLCETPLQNGHACGQCASCQLSAVGNHPDLIVAEPIMDEDAEEGAEKAAEKTGRQEIKVAAVRALIDRLGVGSHRLGRRVVIVDPAEAMNLIAANTLLKILEEPPEAVTFLLLTSAPGRLLPTVRSRCQVFNVAAPDQQTCESAAMAAFFKQAGQGDAQRWLAAAHQAPLRALELASEYADLGVAQRATAWATLQSGPSGGAGVWASTGNVKKGQLKPWLQWFHRYVADCALAAVGQKPRSFPDLERQIQGIARQAHASEWMKLLSAVEQSLRTAEHPLSAALVMDALIVQYCGLLDRKKAA
jgi:DNA polymerase-3 subunit delta'